MVPLMCCSVSLLAKGVTTNDLVVLAKAGTHSHKGFY
jgi:hypothetical protein